MASTPIHVRRVFDHTPAIRAALRVESARAVGATVFGVQGDWQRFTHVLSGLLRSSIRGTHAANALTGYVSTNVGYAVWEQFYGNRYRPPHPAPQPAAKLQAPLFKKRMEDAAERAGKAR